MYYFRPNLFFTENCLIFWSPDLDCKKLNIHCSNHTSQFIAYSQNLPMQSPVLKGHPFLVLS